jgi:RimJ/RimL family protein N-acetyltransferase
VTGAARPGPPAALGLPEPPLLDRAAGIVLRPWAPTPGDVAALVAAWRDPALAQSAGVPDDVSAAAAERWIRGEPARRAAGLCLDLVVGPLGGDAVVGEVGLRNVDRVRRRAEMSWWIAAGHRERGLASAAARLLAGWALAPGGGDLVQVWARTDPADRGSAAVAAAAGFDELGEAAGTTVWARTRRPADPSD